MSRFFRRYYGERGEGFIECHHRQPLDALVEGTKTRIDDLALLCANCHRMFHIQRRWLSVEELKTIINRKAAN
ncbi:MAG: HNH endonuclease [Alphaproteobacteria bacterium]